MPDRFSEVVPGKLYRGGKPASNELRMLKKLFKINKIVSLDDQSGKAINPMCRDLGFQHIIWGLGDGRDSKVPGLKKRIVPQLLFDGPTYVHCYHGKDRTGMCIAMFRVFSGWSLKDALVEAYNFGMGRGLSKDVRNSYYDAVRKFSKEISKDKNNLMDAVTLNRSTNSFGPPGPVGGKTFAPPQADIEFSHLSRIAFAKVYCKCNSSKLLTPNMFWWGTQEAAEQNPTDSDGRVFSANLSSSAKVESFDGRNFTERLLHYILMSGLDVAVLRNNKRYFITNPDVLINIQEEDYNDVNSVIEVGMRDNSTDYSFAFPGSGAGVGGMPDGAAGFVVLPFSGPGQV